MDEYNRDAIEPEDPVAAEEVAGDNEVEQLIVDGDGFDEEEIKKSDQAMAIDLKLKNDAFGEWINLQEAIMHIERMKNEERLVDAFEKLRLLLPGVGQVSTLTLVTSATSYIMHLENLQALNDRRTPPHIFYNPNDGGGENSQS